MEAELRGDRPEALYIPAGFAHGFLSLEDDTLMLYLTTAGYDRECDAGIRWDSIPYRWSVEKPVISERDEGFPLLRDFRSPF